MQPFALHGLLAEARPEQFGRDHDLGSVSHHASTASAAVTDACQWPVRALRSVPDWHDRTR
jgi:hypothetical protein